MMLYITIAAIIVLVGLLIKEKQSAPRDSRIPEGASLPYHRKDFLLTKGERAFFDALQIAVGETYHVFCKVRMLDLFYLSKGTENRKGWNGRIIQKHVDFVLCDRKIIKPVMGIELDDASHDEDTRQERDAFVDRVFTSAGLPLIHVRAAASYDPTTIKNLTLSTLGQEHGVA
jgi:hypothetical protein